MQDVTNLSKGGHVCECPWAEVKFKPVVIDKEINMLNYGEPVARLNHDSWTVPCLWQDNLQILKSHSL